MRRGEEMMVMVGVGDLRTYLPGKPKMVWGSAVDLGWRDLEPGARKMTKEAWEGEEGCGRRKLTSSL
jgi:hypothetical protein